MGIALWPYRLIDAEFCQILETKQGWAWSLPGSETVKENQEAFWMVCEWLVVVGSVV